MPSRALKRTRLDVNEVFRVDLGVERVGQLGLLLRRQVEHIEIVRRAVAVEIERGLRLARRERDRGDAGVRDDRQRDRRVRRGLGDGDLRTAVGIHADGAIPALLRERHVGDVPIGLVNVLVLTRRKRVAAQRRKLAGVVRHVVEILRRRIEGRRREVRLTLVVRDLDGLFRLHVPDEHVAIVGRVYLHQRHPLPIVGHLIGEVAVSILKQHRSRESRGVVAIDVEELRVTLVRADVKGGAARRPAGELRLQLGSGRDVFLFPGGRSHVEVVQLVPGLIAGQEDAFVVSKERDRVGGVGRRARDWRPRATGHRHGVRVPDAGLVRREQDPRLVRRKRGAVDGCRVEELLDCVLLRLASRLGTWWRRTRSGRQRRCDHECAGNDHSHDCILPSLISPLEET